MRDERGGEGDPEEQHIGIGQHADEWVDTTWQSKLSCVGGVAVGALAWFVALSFGASRGHGRCSDDTLLKMSRVSGGLLVLMALYLGARLVMLLSHHR